MLTFFFNLLLYVFYTNIVCFLSGPTEISKKNISRLLDSMTSFKLLMKVHSVDKYLAYATSALRSSSNGERIIDLIEQKVNIKIQTFRVLNPESTSPFIMFN